MASCPKLQLELLKGETPRQVAGKSRYEARLLTALQVLEHDADRRGSHRLDTS